MPTPPSRPGKPTGYPRQRGRAQPEPPPLAPGLPARIAAAAILADVIGGGHTLDDVFAGEGRASKLSALDPRDVALVRSIVTVSLRRLGTLRRAVARLLERGMPKKSGSLEYILLVAAAQLLFLDVPDHAAVNLCVAAARHDPQAQPFAALANAVARNLIAARDELPGVDPVTDVPPWLATRWRAAYGSDVLARIAAVHAVEPRLDVTVKADAAVWAARLDGDLLPTGSIRLRTNAPIPDLPGYADGAWWVQDAAAALPARLLAVRPGERVADLCAAPGGKTAQLIGGGGSVVAVDRSAERLKRLAANLDRLGLTAETKVADAATYDAPPFDAILLDAPCSATGTMRRHPDVGWTKRPSDLTSLVALQARMLDRAVGLMKPGGRVVYCVCSIEPEEGEAQIAALLRRNPDVRRDPVRPDELFGRSDFLTAHGELRTLPFFGLDDTSTGMDGFFAARLVARG